MGYVLQFGEVAPKRVHYYYCYYYYYYYNNETKELRTRADYLGVVAPNEGLLYTAVHCERDQEHLGTRADHVLARGDQQFGRQPPVLHGCLLVQFDGVQQQGDDHHG